MSCPMLINLPSNQCFTVENILVNRQKCAWGDPYLAEGSGVVTGSVSSQGSGLEVPGPAPAGEPAAAPATSSLAASGPVGASVGPETVGRDAGDQGSCKRHQQEHW